MSRAVVFDLDGTLIDSLPDIAAAANAVLSDRGLPPLPEARIGGFVGMGERVFLERLIAATALDPAAFDQLLHGFMEHYKRSTVRTRLFPGVLEALAGLRDAGVALGLCTNKPGEPLAAVMDTLDLAKWFDAIVAGDRLPLRKPHAEPLRLAFEELGATQGVYVGDSEVDAETATNAGVPFVFFTEGIRTATIEEIAHDRRFDNFADLPGICLGAMRPL
ncbi:phosphoglycolate phosphatase [Marivita sp. GX14005]|uniref:phosphoglycolate phosphatase n=1 Tax=Marivita sp. GX14005 TaxID=2942276 RepID=UPI0020186F12|nr:phosphoglycolate phosphatase [Marivita sp. GX14005]MCL3882744.1 phosphoglycolate phosphatase [Marivita sp. GX14005]